MGVASVRYFRLVRLLGMGKQAPRAIQTITITVAAKRVPLDDFQRAMDEAFLPGLGGTFETMEQAVEHVFMILDSTRGRVVLTVSDGRNEWIVDSDEIEVYEF